MLILVDWNADEADFGGFKRIFPVLAAALFVFY